MHQCEVPAEGGINPLHSMELFHSDSLHSQEIYTHMHSMMPGISFTRVQKGNLRKNGEYWFLVDNK